MKKITLFLFAFMVVSSTFANGIFNTPTVEEQENSDKISWSNDNEKSATEKIEIYTAYKTLYISGIDDGTIVDIYSATGAKVLTGELVNGQISLEGLNKGIYIMRAGNYAEKFTLR